MRAETQHDRINDGELVWITHWLGDGISPVIRYHRTGASELPFASHRYIVQGKSNQSFNAVVMAKKNLKP